MHITTKITAFVVAMGAASIATSVKADEACEFGVSMMDNAITLREEGISFRTAIGIVDDAIESANVPAFQEAVIREVSHDLVEFVYFEIPGSKLGSISFRGEILDAFLDGCEGEGV